MILAGGTGGHVFPALAVAENLRDKGAEVFWMGTKIGLEAKIVPQAGFTIDWLKVTGLRGKGWVYKVKAPFMIVLACIQALSILLRRKPGVVLGMGGFVSGPGGLMAAMLRIPLVIHEQNSIPGTTNRLLARFARLVLEAFPGSFDKGVGATFTGNPLRKAIYRDHIGKSDREHPPRLLVMGGSQGAQVLNRTVPKALASLEGPFEVIHQSGPSELEATRAAYANLGIDAQVNAFIVDMAQTYLWADLVVCRAGAMTLSELAASGKPSVLVPFPHAIDDHQTHNAQYFARAEAAILIPQSEFEPGHLAESLDSLMTDNSRLDNMANAARSLARPDSTDTVADFCLNEAR